MDNPKEEHESKELAATPDCRTDEELAREHFQKAARLHKEGDKQGRIDELKEAIRLDPSYIAARIQLGYAFYQVSQWEDCLAVFREILRLDPNNSEAHFEIGCVLLEKKQWAEALAHYREVVRINPSQSQAYTNIGSILYELGNLDQSISAYRQAVAVEQKPSYYFWLGATLMRAGRLDEALIELLEAIRLDPSQADAYMNIGSLYCKRGEFEEGIKAYRQSVALAPNAVNMLWLGIALFHAGQRDEAVVQYKEAIRLDPNNAKAHEALSELLEAQRLDPSLADNYINIGSAHYEKGEWEEAIRAYQKSIALSPSVINMVWLGASLFNAGQRDEAAAQYLEAMRLYPNDPEPHHFYGDALYEKKDFKAAVREWREAVRLGYSEAHIHIDLGRILSMQGNNEAALVEFGRAVEIEPQNADAHNHLGHALHKKRLWQQAMTQYRMALCIDPNDEYAEEHILTILLFKARRYKTIAHWDAAREAVEQALAKRPGWPPALYGVGCIAWCKGNVAEAVRALEEAVLVDPMYEPANCLLTYIYFRTARWRKAIDLTKLYCEQRDVH